MAKNPRTRAKHEADLLEYIDSLIPMEGSSRPQANQVSSFTHAESFRSSRG